MTMIKPTAGTIGSTSDPMTGAFERWLTHFRQNPARQQRSESSVSWDAPMLLDSFTRQAFIRSFQRFELGESGDGRHLLAKAALEGDPVYLAALEMLVAEEQKHSALFRRGLDHLDAPSIGAHWSDSVFVQLRRMLGLRTELGLFLIVESVAMGYFTALAEHAPDPVLRGIGMRIAHDERDHIRFQIDRLRQGFLRTPRVGRLAVGLVWGAIAAGASTVLAIDHGSALRACGYSRIEYWRHAMGEFSEAAISVLADPGTEPLGPLQ